MPAAFAHNTSYLYQSCHVYTVVKRTSKRDRAIRAKIRKKRSVRRLPSTGRHRARCKFWKSSAPRFARMRASSQSCMSSLAWIFPRMHSKAFSRHRCFGGAVLNYTPYRVDGRRQRVTILHWISHTHPVPRALSSILNTNRKWCRFRTRNATVITKDIIMRARVIVA